MSKVIQLKSLQSAVIDMFTSETSLPRLIIFNRVRMNFALMDGTPKYSVYTCNPSGWLRMEVFTEWFNHFVHHAKWTEDLVILILDGHYLFLPPHCTHKLQLLHVCVMFLLSTYHNQALHKCSNFFQFL